MCVIFVMWKSFNAGLAFFESVLSGLQKSLRMAEKRLNNGKQMEWSSLQYHFKNFNNLGLALSNAHNTVKILGDRKKSQSA